MLRERIAVARIALERALDPVDEILIAEGLLQKVERSVLHGFHRHGNVTVSGDEDDRNGRAAQVELLLQLDAAHARHAHIEHQAAGLVLLVGFEEFAGGGHGSGVEPH